MTNWLLKLVLIMMPCILFANNIQQEAVQAYEKGEYQKAADLYESLTKEGYNSADLYYNLGNAYYKAGENAQAILNYERALLYAPNDADLKTNLEIAKLKTVDKIDPVETIFIYNWIDSIRNMNTSNQWAGIAVGAFVLFLGCFALYFIGGKVWMKKIAFFSAILLFILILFANSAASAQKERLVNRDYAIVFAKSVTAKSTPADSGTDLFVLHDGTKVKVKSKVGEWYEVELADGNIGWIPSSKLEII
ncbi:MAG: tetratricopeptide repeat protein [Bacteroidales bacterium]